MPSVAKLLQSLIRAWPGSAERLRQDARQIVRTLTRRRQFTLFAIGTLGLSLGATLLVFTIANALWLRPPPIPNPDRVVMVTGMDVYDTSGNDERFYYGEGGLQSLREQVVFESVAGQVATSGYNEEFLVHLTFPRGTRPVESVGVTSQYFTVLGLRILGRDFTDADDRQGAPLTAIISDQLWRTMFGRSADVIGAVVGTSPLPIRVIGVAPPGFGGVRIGDRADVWIPRYVVPQLISRRTRPSPSMLALARLKPGMTVADAAGALAATRDPRVPGFAQAGSVIPISTLFGSPVGRTVVVRSQPILWTAALTAGLVLVSGCMTLMALMLTHYERRQPELAIRLALGCSYAQLTRVLLLEVFALALPGLVAGLAVAGIRLRAIPTFTIAGLDFGRLDTHPDWRVWLFGVGTAILTLAIAAQVPLRRALHHQLVSKVLSASHGSTAKTFRTRRIVLTLHAAAMVVVLICAGLFVRTVTAGLSRNAGFDIDHTVFLAARLDPVNRVDDRRPAEVFDQEHRVARFLETLRRDPQVTSAEIGTAPNLMGASPTPWGFMADQSLHVMTYSKENVGPSYFDVLGITLLAGRPFSPLDAETVPLGHAPTPAVVTKSFADRLWHGAAAIGKTFSVTGVGAKHQVIGVVADFSIGALKREHKTAFFRPDDINLMVARSSLEVAIRSADLDALVPRLRALLANAFPEAQQVRLTTGRGVDAADLGQEQFGAWFFAGFSAATLILGIGGVFATVTVLVVASAATAGVSAAWRLGRLSPNEVLASA
jgi:predicted permease